MEAARRLPRGDHKSGRRGIPGSSRAAAHRDRRPGFRACEQRQVPPHDHDLADQDSLLLAIGNACALAGSDVLRHLEPQVAAWTGVIARP